VVRLSERFEKKPMFRERVSAADQNQNFPTEGRNPMTEATPPPGEKGEKQPRDAAFWAQRVERLEVTAVPQGAANVNVQGRREVGALQGFGQLWQKTYRVRLTGAEVTPEEVVQVWKERFPSSSRRTAGSTLLWRASRPGRCCLSAPPWEACRCIRVSA
jgi:hypothetical protein